jgi:Mce-associated membrane protein
MSAGVGVMTDETPVDSSDGPETPENPEAPVGPAYDDRAEPSKPAPAKTTRARATAAKPTKARAKAKSGESTTARVKSSAAARSASEDEDEGDEEGRRTTADAAEAGEVRAEDDRDVDDDVVGGGDLDDDAEAVVPDNGEAASPTWLARGRHRVGANPVALVIGVVAVALAVALVLTVLALSNRNALDSARAGALAAARTDAVELAGYNYHHLNRDFGAVLATSTPSFRQSFTQSSDALKSTLSRYHAIAVAKVVSAGLVSASTSRAVALVFLDQKITNSTQKTATTDRSQVEITLVDTGGRWLIDQVSLL